MKKLMLFLSFFLLFSCSNSQDITHNEVENINNSKKILALWDSLTAGYWLDISESYPSKLQKKLEENWYSYEVINAWVSGHTSDDLLSRISLYEDNYDIVIILIWWNDWLRWNSLVNLEENLQKIIDNFKDTNSKIVLGWLTKLPLNLWLNYIKEFSQVYEKIAKNNPNIYFLDDFLKDVWWVKKYNLDDQIHPNSKWYDLIVENLNNFLNDNNLLIK